MIDFSSAKVSTSVLNRAKDVMRDEHFPFENDLMLITIAVDYFCDEWERISKKADPHKYVDFYDFMMKKIAQMKKEKQIDENARGIKTLEKIKNAK